jgi:valyl-tRNA synthetase
VGHCQRCATVSEPFLSSQWFVKISPLAKPALQAVRDGSIRFIPEMWSKTYFEWMENVHDWCISRQLWWGHRIPAWHCGRCAEIVVARQAPARCPRCAGDVTQDPDVLDTWFSSGLWPFSTLGWPGRTPDLRRYYPTTTLITGFDIIFFWVARMIMMGLKFTGKVPFREVYFSGLVRDAQGQKMSRTKGNVIDPVQVMDRYGTDAVRFTLAMLASPGSDIPLAEERMEGYRAFANKLWNAGRFVITNLRPGDGAVRLPRTLSRVDHWILQGLEQVTRDVNAALDAFRFDQAAHALYHFIWHQFCDWYIELVKPALLQREAAAKPGRAAARSRAVLLHVLDQVLRLLHPFMPYITEELWQRLPHSGPALAAARYPAPRTGRTASRAARAAREMAEVLELVTRIRHVRAGSNIDPGRRIELQLRAGQKARRLLLEEEMPHIAHLARCTRVELVDRLDEGGTAARGVAQGVEFAIPLEGLLDMGAEQARLRREIERLARDLAAHERKLESPDFLARAPGEVVARTRGVFNELKEKKERLEQTLRQMGG